MAMTDERKFLHDVAGPIATSLFIAEILDENLSAKLAPTEDDLLLVKQILESLGKVKTMLSERRDILIAKGDGQ